MMTDYIKAKEENCSMIVSDDVYRKFYCASFYYNQGYGPVLNFFCKKSLMKKGYLKLFYYGLY
jgi:hypothetical protein